MRDRAAALVHVTRQGRRILAAVLGVALCLPSIASAVVRTCGADAVANTTNVLCASPSGPCNATSVTMSANIEVTNAGCAFNLQGRTLSIQKTFEMIGTGFIKVIDAGDITITPTGKLKARGDFVKPDGFIIEGGVIALSSTGTILHRGLIDVNGDAAGLVRLIATGDVTLDSGSETRGVGTSSFSGADAHFADGGVLEIESSTGDVRVDGPVRMTGQSSAFGGDIVIQAAGDVEITHQLDASGGEGGGGTIDIMAGDDLFTTNPVDAASQSGGGDGGTVQLLAGQDAVGGAITGGTLAVGAAVDLQGSQGSGFGGNGGDFVGESHGAMVIDSPIRVGAGIAFAGNGGFVTLDSGDEDPESLSALDGDMSISGMLVGRSGDDGGWGGVLEATAGRNLFLSVVDLGGKDGGGTVLTAAPGAMNFTADVTADGTAAAADGGVIDARGCELTVGPNVNLDASGASGAAINLVGRDQVTVVASADVDATSTGALLRLVTRTVGPTNPDTDGTTSQFHPAPTIVQDSSLPACP